MQDYVTQVRLEAALEHLNAVTKMVKSMAEVRGIDVSHVSDNLDHVSRVVRYIAAMEEGTIHD